jgi:hypothetical protein
MSDAAHEPASPTRRVRDVGTIIAALIGLLALVVSAYTAWLQRQQVRAQVWPYIESGWSQSGRFVLLANKGVGPARVETLKVFVDGVPHRDWNAVFKALDVTFDVAPPWSTSHGIVLSAGSHIQQLSFKSDADFQKFDPLYRRIDIAACYCSSLGECWQLDERENDPAKMRREIDRCVRSDEDFTQ